ncbi:MAG: hypothetical protein KIT73_16955, partial [Burkholderiales bacterium]|nr:hypothetical protein [Burkholderiales bacterium]
MTAPPRPSVVLRGYALVSCLFAATIIVWWLLQHPFGAATMALPIAGYLVVVTMWPATWLVLLPALWPIADLARWTGQIHVTETDALLLATVAGVGLRTSFSRHALPAEEPWQYRVRIS